MSKLSNLFPSLIFIAVLCSPALAAGFSNPILKSADAGCAPENMRAERFTAETDAKERVKLCMAIDKITNKLNETAWSSALRDELQSIWQVFSNENVALRPMPKNASSRMLAMAEAFPAGVAVTNGNFAASVSVRPEKSDGKSFFQVLYHELRHVYDFYETWKNKTTLDSMEIERRAFVLMGKMAQETPEKEKFSNLPKFWKESWRKSTAEEISAKRVAAIDKFLFGSKYYRNMAQDAGRQTLDFSYLKTAANNQTNVQYIGGGAYDKKGGERLPVRASLPATASVLPQNIREANFNLEKPQNPRDAKEILRVALANERKLYYGMSNFVYDQKLAFQCWQKGKVSASFDENNTVARTEKGGVLFQNALFQSAAATPCALDSQNLKTDFTETFWASPALDKMPINFVGFVQVEGKTLARYTVLQPGEQLFNQLANQFPNIKPFRVFVGTIFISPEDGQIVRFWGTSFPEDHVTGASEQKIWGSYSVTALRQKLNIDSGLWVTVYVGTVAVANVSGNSRPFSYTVKFENYRQSTTDVRILDDDAAAAEIVRGGSGNYGGSGASASSGRR